MKESLDQLQNQQPGCPDFVKAMVPSNGKIILCGFHPTMVNTTIEIKAKAGKAQRFDEAYEFELKITYFDPKMGMWAMYKDETTGQENAKAEKQIKQEERDAKQSPLVVGPVEIKPLNDGTGKAWYQKQILSEDNVLGTSKKPPEDIYYCDYLIIQDKGLVINFPATAGSKEMADGWLDNIRAKLTQAGY
ncbi:MAG: hypothetical protein ABSG73_12740 [Candidatus Aminicenantales bacterium]|jgi:hypothetical protein